MLQVVRAALMKMVITAMLGEEQSIAQRIRVASRGSRKILEFKKKKKKKSITLPSPSTPFKQMIDNYEMWGC